MGSVTFYFDPQTWCTSGWAILSLCTLGAVVILTALIVARMPRRGIQIVLRAVGAQVLILLCTWFWSVAHADCPRSDGRTLLIEFWLIERITLTIHGTFQTIVLGLCVLSAMLRYRAEVVLSKYAIISGILLIIAFNLTFLMIELLLIE